MHTVKEINRILARINRIIGQLESVSETVQNEHHAHKVLQVLASSRGAITGLMGEIIEGHIMEHIVEADSKKDAAQAGREVNEILKSFWK